MCVIWVRISARVDVSWRMVSGGAVGHNRDPFGWVRGFVTLRLSQGEGVPILCFPIPVHDPLETAVFIYEMISVSVQAVGLGEQD